MKGFDKFISYFSKMTSTLRGFERGDGEGGTLVPTKEHIELFDKLLNMLHRRKKYAIDQDCWEELYRRSFFFYKYTDNIQGIPTVFVTKHNDIVPWYCKMRVHKVSYTLIHMDSHADFNPVKGNKHLPRLYDEFLRGDDNSLERINNIVWDIGAANSGIMYTTGARNYVWCMPRWLPDKEMSLDYFMYGKNDQLMVSNDIKAKNVFCDIEYTRRHNKNAKTWMYSKIRTGRTMNESIDKVYKSIKVNGDNYILDIDLDYIICNGKSIDREEYKKEPYDIRSHKRTEKMITNQNIPRDNNYMSTQMISYNRALDQEVMVIKDRIKQLLKFVKGLYRRGLTPAYISICDSTNVKFEDCKTCNSVSNGYVPTHLALYVHTRITAGLYKIFRKI